MKKFKISHVFIYLLLILLTLICVVPFYIMVINATHSTNELYAGLNNTKSECESEYHMIADQEYQKALNEKLGG